MEAAETLAPLEDADQAPPEAPKLTEDDTSVLDRLAKIRAAHSEKEDAPKEVAKTDEVAKEEPANDTEADEKEVPEAEESKPKLSLAERLAERLAARKEKQQAKNEYQSLKQQVEQRERALQEYEQRLQAQFHQERQRFEQERQQWLRDIASDPIKLVTEAGHTPEDIIRNIQLSGDPQWQMTQAMQRQVAELNAKLEKERQEREQFMTQEQQRQQQYQEQQAQRAHQQAVNVLLNEIASPEKAPALHRLYDADEIVERVQKIIVEYKNRTGEVASLDEAAEYAEQLARKRLDGSGIQVTGQPAKAKGTATRTLSAAAASERRATPRSNQDLTDEELDSVIQSRMASIRAGRQ